MGLGVAAVKKDSCAVFFTLAGLCNSSSSTIFGHHTSQTLIECLPFPSGEQALFNLGQYIYLKYGTKDKKQDNPLHS